jgi:misacylated tRNA(Ala) deacylase
MGTTKVEGLLHREIRITRRQISYLTAIPIFAKMGLDLQADGGTHVKNTSEVGTIKVVDYKSKGAINKRVYIEVL